MTEDPGALAWTEAERDAWRPPEDLTVAEWAERFRIIPPGINARPGPWRNDRAPYLQGIMEAWTEPTVEQITVMKCTQSGGTEALLNCLGYSMDQRPGSMILVLPTEADAKKLMRLRVRPLIEQTAPLRRRMSEWKADNTQSLVKIGEALLTLAWANSASSLASTPVRDVLLDEVDKYPAFAGKEADPVSLARERQRTFLETGDAKRCLSSTPTLRDGLIFREWLASDQRRYWIPCLSCGTYHVPAFELVKWPEDVRDPEQVLAEDLARFTCAKCGHAHDDGKKAEMLARGVWCPEGCKVRDGKIVGKVPTNRNRGFHIPATILLWTSWSRVAAEFLGSYRDRSKLLNFQNSWMGWPWEEKGENVDADYLATRTAPHAAGEVPSEAKVLTCGIDVGDYQLHYVVRAWGVGERSWLVEAGIVQGIDALVDRVLTREFPVTDGTTARVFYACIDSGDGEHAPVVYRFCRKWLHVLRPTKGVDTLSGIPLQIGRVDRTHQGLAARYGIKLWRFSTDFYKSKVLSFMRIPMSEPGAWTVHRDPGRQYLEECSSEHRIARKPKTGKPGWVTKPGAGRNHFWDAEVLTAVAADMAQVHRLRDEHARLGTVTARARPSPPPRTRGDDPPPREPQEAARNIRENIRGAPARRRGKWAGSGAGWLR